MKRPWVPIACALLLGLAVFTPGTAAAPPPTHGLTFFSRATAPFEGPLRSCLLDEDRGSVVDCLKEKATVALERAALMDTVALGESVALVKRVDVDGGQEDDWTSNAVATAADSEDVDTRLIRGLARFLRGRALRLSLPDDLVPMVTSSLEEGRLKKHKHLGTLITCIAVVLKTLALASIAFMAKKALLLGKISLLLSAAVLMKKMGGGGGGTSYEVVSLHRRASHLPNPNHLHHHPHHQGEVYGSGYGVAGAGGGGADEREGSLGTTYAVLRRAKGFAGSREVVDDHPRALPPPSPAYHWSLPQFQIEKQRNDFGRDKHPPASVQSQWEPEPPSLNPSHYPSPKHLDP